LRSTLGTWWKTEKSKKYMSKPLNKTRGCYLFKGFSFEKKRPKVAIYV
jgi:hypothetical protein